MTAPTSPRRERSAGQRGFSMLEIFIILGIVAILAAIASPVFKDMVGRYRLNAASRSVAGYIAQARMLAVTRGTYVRLMVTARDASPTDPSVSEGVFRLEQWTLTDAGTWQWQLVNDPLGRASGLLPPANCTASAVRLNEYCVDLKTDYRGVSIAWMDASGGSGGTGQWIDPPPGADALVYGPDGFIANLRSDFTAGDPQSIQMVLANKRSNGLLEGRILVVDRAGNVTIRNYKGEGLPAT